MEWKTIKRKAWDIACCNKWNVWKPVLIIAIVMVFLELALGMIFPKNVVGIIVDLLILPIGVGLSEYMLCLFRDQDFSTSTLFSRYSEFVPIFVLLGVFVLMVVGGTLLLIIPGIIIALTYTFLNNVYIDNPGCSRAEIMDKTKELMMGNRLNYFLFSLSFIGWSFVIVFTVGIAAIWVVPYIQLAQVSYYEALKESKGL